MNEGMKKQNTETVAGGGVLKSRVDWGLGNEEGGVMPKDSWSHWEEMETMARTEVQKKTFLCVLGHIFWQRWEEVLKDKMLKKYLEGDSICL